VKWRSNLECEVKIFRDTAALADKAARRFVAMAATARQQESSCTVALSGGTTPRALYTLLASAPYRAQVDWSRIDFYFGDERGVPPDHPDSNYRLASDSLFRPNGISSGQVHRMRGEMEDLSAAADLYTTELTAVVDEGLPRFDLVLLGLGPDGHTASLFPNNWALHECVRWVVSIRDAPKPPSRRLTLTVPVFNHARQVMFLVAGADKAAAVREVLRGSAPADHYPAKLIQPGAGRVLWLLDEGAGSLLDHSSQSALLS
jgi:6-phosphogluconolactonase